MTTTGRADAPYADACERLLEELVRVDLLLRRHLEAWWAASDGQADELRGLYVSDEEVDRLLSVDVAAPAEPSRTAGRGIGTASRTDLDARIEHLTRRIDARAARTARDGEPTRLGHLAAQFDLDRHELDVLLCALAPDVDGKYEKVYGYLQDDVTRHRPTVGFLLSVLAGARREELATRATFEPGSTLVDSGLVSVPIDGETFVSRPVSVSGRVASYLLGGDRLPGNLTSVASIARPEGSLSDLPVDEGTRARLDAIAEELATTDRAPRLAAFVGPDERTARDAVAAVCATADRPIVEIEAAALVDGDHSGRLDALGRELRLQDAAACVTDAGAIDAEPGQPDGAADRPVSAVDPIEALVARLDELPGDVFLTGEADVTARLEPRLAHHAYVDVGFPRPPSHRREALWAAVPDLPDDVDPEELAATFRLTRGQIEDAISTARAVVDGELTREAIRVGCRAHATRTLTELAREVEPGYDWDDIVLPPDARAHLREAAIHVRHRGTVFEDWGFEESSSRGNGITLLFTGPSGTGKTMAAEVLANDAGLPLFVIDLSAVISKYIGETEKNLRRVFDAAERGNAILFFDEADALFGKRSEVSDSHDRYANVEVDYLLQRVERHDGCIVLASNLEENVDGAFLRRINLTVSFPHPDRDGRAEIWRGVFPEETPRGELDVPFLADFELTGGNIRNVATTAAFLAAEEGTAVEMSHLVRALRRELQKTGRLFERSDFGEYGTHLGEI